MKTVSGSMKKRVKEMTAPQFNEFATDFFVLFCDPEFSLFAPGNVQPGQNQLFDLLVKWGFETGDLRIDDVVAFKEAAGAIIGGIKRRSDGLQGGLAPYLDQAELFMERYSQALPGFEFDPFSK